MTERRRQRTALWMVAVVLLAGVVGAVTGLVLAGRLQGGDPDVSAFVATQRAPVFVDGEVVSVSPHGLVLVTRAGRACLDDLAGIEQLCFDVPIDAEDHVSWSSDGNSLVVPTAQAVQRFVDSDLTLLDIERGEVRALTEDGSDDPNGGTGSDLFPAWSGDDEVWFLRHHLAEQQIELGRVDMDGHVQLAPTDISTAELRDAAPRAGGGVLMVVVAPADGPASLVSVEPNGAARSRLAVGEFPVITSVDADGTAVTLTPRLRAGPAGLLTLATPEETTEAGFSGTGAVSPDGRLVAALSAPPTGGDRARLVLWDPDSGAQARLRNDAGQGSRRITWTSDRQLVVWGADAWRVVDLTTD